MNSGGGWGWGMFLQSSSNYSALPFEEPPDGANSNNNHLDIIFIEMAVSKYNGLITCSLKNYFQLLQSLAQNLPMETQESMYVFLQSNQPNHSLFKCKNYSFGGKKTHQTPNFNRRRKERREARRVFVKQRRQAGLSLVFIQRKPLFMFWYVLFSFSFSF